MSGTLTRQPATAAIDTTSPPLDEEESRELSARLERVYTRIYHERMQGVPVLNPDIGVRAIGLRQWQNTHLCIMVTPWFMNIMLLPDKTTDWSDLRETSRICHTFPSGRYEFLVGYEPELGKYQMCSLFSPMFEFASHEAAVETAEAAITELMNENNIAAGDIDSRQIERIWAGEEPHPDKVHSDTASNHNEDRIPLHERMNTTISRRQLLRGAATLGSTSDKRNTTGNDNGDTST